MFAGTGGTRGLQHIDSGSEAVIVLMFFEKDAYRTLDY